MNKEKTELLNQWLRLRNAKNAMESELQQYIENSNDSVSIEPHVIVADDKNDHRPFKIDRVSLVDETLFFVAEGNTMYFNFDDLSLKQLHEIILNLK